MKVYPIFPLLALFFVSLGCQPSDSCPNTPSEAWMPGFYSGMELTVAKDTLTAKSFTAGPPIEGGVEEVLSVLDYFHLGSYGVLKLYFFEKHLMRARFIPDNADVYGANFDAWLPETRKSYADTETEKLKDAMTSQRYVEWRSRCRMGAYSEWVASESMK